MWGHGYGMGYGVGMWLGGVLLLVVVVTLVVLLVRSAGSSSPPPPQGGPGPAARAREVLDERYARGEISTEEYRERRAHLDGS